MTTNPDITPAPAQPSEDAIRDYAYHLYEQSGRRAGHDLDNWLEAEACLAANVARSDSHQRLQRQLATEQSEEMGIKVPKTRQLSLVPLQLPR